MKNARKYERKIRKLLSTSKAAAEAPPEPRSPMQTLLLGILQADAQDKQAEGALEILEREYVDFNELRASQPKEIVEAVGKDYPNARRKAEMITRVLNALFAQTNSIDIDYMAEMTKRDLRRHLLELGLDRYASAYLAMVSFGAHAVCVDDTLVGCLEMDGRIEPGSDIADVQGFLERVVAQKDGLAAHQVLRAYAAKRARALARKRRAEDAAEKARAEKAAAEKAKAVAEKARKAKKVKKARKRVASRPAKAARRSAKKAKKAPRRK